MFVHCRSWITVGGIRSTGLTACLAIARRVGDMIEKDIDLEPSFKSVDLTARDTEDAGRNVSTFPDGLWADIGSKRYKITHPLSQLGFSGKSKL